MYLLYYTINLHEDFFFYKSYQVPTILDSCFLLIVSIRKLNFFVVY